ncbi:hypothetical protein KY325_01330, partial [Candidatus Woesearchaeota archaeon]|nr:hypothetical protein [Candidatus Woesearchaeota archaeon]
VKDLLKLYTPFIRVNGTANGMRLTDPNPMAQGIYDSLFFSMFEDYKFPDTQINYYFLDWPIDFHVTPPAGPGILKPKSYKTEYPFGIWQSSQRNLYEFFYDISFPVVVEIYDSKALGGKGYSFFFALEGNILDNKNLLDWNQGLGTVSWDQSIYSIEINPDAGGTHTLEGGEAIFGQFNASNEFVLNATTPIHTKSLFDRFEQKISNVTIYTKDKKTGQYLTEVAVEFICGRYKAASLGATELLEDGKSGIITKAPICYGDGRLRFDLINYDTLTLGPISTEVDGNLILTAELEPVRQQEVSFKKVARIEPSGENITVTNIYQDLQFYEKAIVILQKEKTSPYDSKLSVALSFDTAENKIVEIPPGQYSINVIIMDSRNMTIQPEKRVYKVDDEDYEVWIPPEPIEFDELMSGGLEYNNNTCGLVNIHDYELDADNVLEIRSLLIKRPFIRVEDISELGRIAEYTNTSCTTLRPRFI